MVQHSWHVVILAEYLNTIQMYNIVSLAVAIVKYNIQYICGQYGLCKIE